MIKTEGVAIASVLGATEVLKVFGNEGGFVAPEVISQLASYDIKTIALIGVFLWVFRKKDEDKADCGPSFTCPYAEKTETNQG
jgi:hypothetical protein